VSDDSNRPAPDPSQPPSAGPYSQQIQQTSVAARLPERVASGIFSSGVIVMEGPDEFVLDFVQGLSRPPRVGARVVLSPNVMSQFVSALRDNLGRYEQAFGPPKLVPKPNSDRRPSIQEIYQDLRLPDDVLSGVYANTVMIGHSPSEFLLEFITRFFPTAAVSARIYVASSQVPQMLAGMTAALQNRRGRQGEHHEPPSGN